MTKKLIKLIIVGYQNISRSPLPACRFSPTCSQYCLESIEKFGILKGTYLSTKRILSCHPFSKRPAYDPV